MASTIKETLEQNLSQEEINEYKVLLDELDFSLSDEVIELCSTTCINYK